MNGSRPNPSVSSSTTSVSWNALSPRWFVPVASTSPVTGWALAAQGQSEAGIAQMHQGVAAQRATGSTQTLPAYLARLAEAYGGIGQAEEGLCLLAEALAMVDHTGVRYDEAELYRIKG